MSGPYRKQIARIPRPLNVKARSALQHCTYYNSIYCNPKMDSSPAQQNFAVVMCLNSPWLFWDGFDTMATSSNRQFVPNSTIIPVPASGQPITTGASTTTCVPGVIDGPETINAYAQGCVVGTKVTLVATPIDGDTNTRIQAGLFYAIKHTQRASGISNTSDINTINTMPFRQAKQIAASNMSNTVNPTRYQASRIVVNHSPRKFNNIQSIRDNKQFFFTAGSSPKVPDEGDYLTFGVTPMLKYNDNGSTQQAQAPAFRLDMRVEQKILWTEPLEQTSTGQGNYSYPFSAYHYNPRPTLQQLKASIPRRRWF